jgi:hypothetical protein
VDYVAELIDIVTHQKKLRQNIIQGQQQRLARFKNIDRIKNLLRIVDGLKK